MVASKKEPSSSSYNSGGTLLSVPQLPDRKPASFENNSDMSFKAFKPRKLTELTETETVASVNSWQQNLDFHIASVNEFAPFLDIKWKPKSVTNRGLQDDNPGDNSKTAAQKNKVLTHMLGLIVSFCPENIRLEIERKCTSLDWIWNRVRRHYGFTKSEGSFLKLAGIKLEEGERYETFFQRI